MNIAVIGNGRTGQFLESLIKKENLVGVYNHQQPPTFEDLKAADAAIIFVPASALRELYPLLLESQVPVVTGTTGLHWSTDMQNEIADRGCRWIVASNFSLGMNLMFQLTQKFNHYQTLLSGSHLAIDETHHVHKVDSPSGTALKLKELVSGPVNIESRREGDVIGFHQLTLENGQERLQLSHAVNDRSVFDAGALWVTENLLPGLEQAGLYHFEQLFGEYYDQQQ
jgi:4-hydroxy-tetrahydrodipicolinate reductase